MHLALAPRCVHYTFGGMAASSPDRTRVSLVLVSALWISAAAILFIGFRLRLKPVMLVGLLDAALAFAVTTLVLAGRRRAR